MSLREIGAIDCDIHPTLPGLKALLPYLSDHWRDSVVNRGIHELEFDRLSANSPLTARADWRPEKGKPASTVDLMRDQALEPFGTRFAILNCLYGVQLLFSEDMSAGFHARAERLDREGVARQGAAAARLDRGAGAEPAYGGRRDRASRGRQALRAGADAGGRRSAARAAALLADLRGGGAPRSAGRHPRRQRLPPSDRRRSAGRPTTPRIMPTRRRPSRPR